MRDEAKTKDQLVNELIELHWRVTALEVKSSESEQRAVSIVRSTLTIFGSVGDELVVADKEGKFLLWNFAAEQTVERGAADIPSDEWSEYYGGYLLDKVMLCPGEQLPLLRAVQGEDVNEVELFIRHENYQGFRKSYWKAVNG